MPIANLPFKEYSDFKDLLGTLDHPGAQKVLELIKGTEQEVAYVFANQLIKPNQREVNEKKIQGFVKLLEGQVALTRKELVMLECIVYLTIHQLQKFGDSDILTLYKMLFTIMQEKLDCPISETTKKRLDAISLPSIILEAIR